jgi:hypothetical protein
MFMCVVNLELVNKLDLTWKQSFVILRPIEFKPPHMAPEPNAVKLSRS